MKDLKLANPQIKRKNKKSKPCYSNKLLEDKKIADIKLWFDGSLITKASHGALTWKQIHESNNRQGRSK